MITKEECIKALDNIKMLGGINIPLESLETIENLIEEHFDKKENTAEFKHFKLYSDSTLKLMKKDELISYIHMLYRNWQYSDKSKQRLHNIIDDLTENNPLKFEELEVVKPYWNNKEKEWCYFATLHNDLKTGVKITISSPPLMSAFKFEENMFYRKEVKE